MHKNDISLHVKITSRYMFVYSLICILIFVPLLCPMYSLGRRVSLVRQQIYLSIAQSERIAAKVKVMDTMLTSMRGYTVT